MNKATCIQVLGAILQGIIIVNSFTLLQLDRSQLTAVTSTNMATGKSFAELLQHDNNENLETKWKIYKWVTQHDTDANDNIHACVAPHDAHSTEHIH